MELDFGDVFDGTDLWMEIEVDTTVLSPRQHLTAAPYALYAGVAGSTSYPALVSETGQRRTVGTLLVVDVKARRSGVGVVPVTFLR